MSELRTAWKGISKYFVCSVLICYVICLHFGFYGWILYSPEVLITSFFNVSKPSQLPDPYSQMFFLEVTLDLFPLGALVGSLLSGYMADRFGRKGSIMVNNILTIISLIFLTCDVVIYAYEFTICAHLLTGICLGAHFCLIYLYLFEIAPRPIRGGVIMLTDVFVKLGNVIGQIVTIPSLIGQEKGWYLLLFLSAIIPMTLILLLPMIPESPRYLLIQKDDEETARNVLQRLKLSGDVEEEIEELREEKLSEMEEKKTYRIHFGRIHFGKVSVDSWRLVTMIVILAGTQFLNFNELYYRNVEILKSIEIYISSTWVLRIGISLLLGFLALLPTYLVDYLGRRILFLTGFAICTVSLILMVVMLDLLRYQKHSLLSYLCVILLVISMATFCIGPNIISVIITLELFLQSSRASGIAMGGFIYCLANIILTLMKNRLKKELGFYTLLIFSPFCAVVFIYVYMYIPETKNQTLKDIKTMMAKQRNRKIHDKTDMVILRYSPIMDRNMGESRKSVQIMTKEGPEEMLKTYPKEVSLEKLNYMMTIKSDSIVYGA
ncbi:solute carrier family 2, facilitated glucose transporter member 7-like [Erythrolamprus reginae]|uniref:solute carrier family 2, facilitated glucose transporter member 7-like n=1 Tax=Erythrolamprus reginae TaxID=121349 RepID=UPI00396C41C0